jgi:hypothetical protein
MNISPTSQNEAPWSGSWRRVPSTASASADGTMSAPAQNMGRGHLGRSNAAPNATRGSTIQVGQYSGDSKGSPSGESLVTPSAAHIPAPNSTSRALRIASGAVGNVVPRRRPFMPDSLSDIGDGRRRLGSRQNAGKGSARHGRAITGANGRCARTSSCRVSASVSRHRYRAPHRCQRYRVPPDRHLGDAQHGHQARAVPGWRRAGDTRSRGLDASTRQRAGAGWRRYGAPGASTCQPAGDVVR